MQFFDTHCHIDDEQFDGKLDDVVRRCGEAGVDRVIAVGTTVAASRKCIELAEKYSSVFAAVGIQPNYCAEAAQGDFAVIEELAKHPQVVAIGETGLDRYWDYSPFGLQEEYFENHIRLSMSTGLPFIVHMRDCGDDIVRVLQNARQWGTLSGVMHSFTGDWELAQQCLELGLYISFAGMVTYKKSDDLRSVAGKIPADRLLIETDAPYLSPHPHRGQRPNEPALVVHTAACLAEVRNVTLEEIAALTTVNAGQLFAQARI